MQVEPLEGTAEPIDGVHLATLASGDGMSVQYFRIEPGAEVPMHSHPHEQVGYVFAGTLTFTLADGDEVAIAPDGSYAFAGDEPHGATNAGDEDVIGIDVFNPPRPNPDWAE